MEFLLRRDAIIVKRSGEKRKDRISREKGGKNTVARVWKRWNFSRKRSKCNCSSEKSRRKREKKNSNPSDSIRAMYVINVIFFVNKVFSKNATFLELFVVLLARKKKKDVNDVRRNGFLFSFRRKYFVNL